MTVAHSLRCLIRKYKDTVAAVLLTTSNGTIADGASSRPSISSRRRHSRRCSWLAWRIRRPSPISSLSNGTFRFGEARCAAGCLLLFRACGAELGDSAHSEDQIVLRRHDRSLVHRVQSLEEITIIHTSLGRIRLHFACVVDVHRRLAGRTAGREGVATFQTLRPLLVFAPIQTGQL